MDKNLISNQNKSKPPRKELLGRIFAGSVSIVIFYFLQKILKNKLKEGVFFPLNVVTLFLLIIIYLTMIVWVFQLIGYIFLLITQCISHERPDAKGEKRGEIV